VLRNERGRPAPHVERPPPPAGRDTLRVRRADVVTIATVVPLAQVHVSSAGLSMERWKVRAQKNAGRGVDAAGIARKWEGERREKLARHASAASRQAATPALPSWAGGQSRYLTFRMYDSTGGAANSRGGFSLPALPGHLLPPRPALRSSPGPINTPTAARKRRSAPTP
jgi:hypothetical protein